MMPPPPPSAAPRAPAAAFALNYTPMFRDAADAAPFALPQPKRALRRRREMRGISAQCRRRTPQAPCLRFARPRRAPQVRTIAPGDCAILRRAAAVTASLPDFHAAMPPP